MIGPQKKWFECGSVAQPASALKLLKGNGGPGEIRTHDLFHAI
jgi:hypothetical protein